MIALSVFAGLFYKKQGADPEPLLRYLTCRLREKDAVYDLILLNEYITKMCGIEILNASITDDQIMSAGCGDTVKTEAYQSSSAENRPAGKRTLAQLKQSLQKGDRAMEILVLLYHLREVCLNDVSDNASVLGAKIDHVRHSLFQYMELLMMLFEEDEYVELIPDVHTLATKYGLPSDIIMHLTRPKLQAALRRIEPEAEPSDEPHPVFRPLLNDAATIAGDPSVLDTMSAEFYTIFWQLSLYDIYVPEDRYKAALKRHADTIAQCKDPQSKISTENRPSVVAKMERQAQASIDSIERELPEHRAHVEKVMQVLKASQDRWFPPAVERLSMISNLIQHCLLKRSVVSEVDAVYCSEFALLMHRLGVRYFSSLTLFDKILSENLPSALLAMTEYETTVHARFIFRTFAKMTEWHENEELFIKEAHGEGLIGFQKKWNAQISNQDVAKDDLISYADFKRVMHKWHLKTSMAIEQALYSDDPHQIRNAYQILHKFTPHFPKVKDHGKVLVKATESLVRQNQPSSYKTLARSYLNFLTKSGATWVSKYAFQGLPEVSNCTLIVTAMWVANLGP